MSEPSGAPARASLPVLKYGLIDVDSFALGLGSRRTDDVINALYLSREVLRFDVPMNFHNEDAYGVGCHELTRKLRVEGIKIKYDGSIDNMSHKAGKLFSKYESNNLGYAAQFVWDSTATHGYFGVTHLHPEHVFLAARILKDLEMRRKVLEEDTKK
jgi:hypothetical protein